jgi:hypothetical protein
MKWIDKRIILVLIGLCSFSSIAQVKIPQSNQAKPSTDNKSKSLNTSTTQMADVELNWAGQSQAIIHVNAQSFNVYPTRKQFIKLPLHKALEIKVQQTNQTYQSNEFLLIDKSGGELVVYLHENKCGFQYNIRLNNLVDEEGFKYTYNGEVMVDLPHGWGLATYHDGSVYKGNFLSGQRQGNGFYKWSDGSTYKGVFENGKQSGFGILSNPDGKEIYKGYFKNGVIHGFGTYTWPDGTSYRGDFENGKKSGFGILSNPNGKEIYNGYFKNDAMHGFGTYTWPDGTSYHGDFENGKKSGFGSIYDSNGLETYQGYFKDDKQIP